MVSYGTSIRPIDTLSGSLNYTSFMHILLIEKRSSDDQTTTNTQSRESW